MPRFPHFELTEFISSYQARKRLIDNSPTFDAVENIAELIEKFLEPLRVAWGKPITINSGYRCTQLNIAVGGVLNSAHKAGLAADITSGDTEKFFNFISEWVKAEGIMFDQIFIEKKGLTKWIHVGLRSLTGQQRRMISRINIE